MQLTSQADKSDALTIAGNADGQRGDCSDRHTPAAYEIASREPKILAGGVNHRVAPGARSMHQRRYITSRSEIRVKTPFETDDSGGLTP
jgi:hypothetical protein